MVLTALTWNIRGLNAPTKRARMWKYILDKKIEVLALQETHMKRGEDHRLKHRQYPFVFKSSGPGKRCGVALMFHASTKFQMIDHKADKEGRYMLVKGQLHGRVCTFASIYAPNTNQAIFLSRFLGVLGAFAEGLVILMGDFNWVWDPSLDCSAVQRTITGRFADSIKDEMQHLGLRDAWRLLHPGERDYTFFSNPHRSYSRIDFIFTSAELVHSLKSSTIYPTIISDHAPLDLQLQWPRPLSTHKKWYFPLALIRDRVSRDELRIAIREYFAINDPADTSIATTWDAFKAYIRGHCIGANSVLNRQRRQERISLEGELAKAEECHKQTPTRPLQRTVTAIRGKLNAIYSNRAEMGLLKLHRANYDQGGKVGSMLARQLRVQRERERIGPIRNGEGREIVEDQGKADLFGAF